MGTAGAFLPANSDINLWMLRWTIRLQGENNILSGWIPFKTFAWQLNSEVCEHISILHPHALPVTANLSHRVSQFGKKVKTQMQTWEQQHKKLKEGTNLRSSGNTDGKTRNIKKTPGSQDWRRVNISDELTKREGEIRTEIHREWKLLNTGEQREWRKNRQRQTGNTWSKYPGG